MKSYSKKPKAIASRNSRKKYGNKYDRKYEKTINGFLMRAYRNMKSRVTGIQKKKFYLYQGKSILPKESFYSWSKNNSNFLALYKYWVSNNYDRRLTPSINRVNSSKGYELANMEWITHSQNSALSSVTKKINKQDKQIIYELLKIGDKN